jgi:P-type E1-E2 ATPase
VQNAIHLVLVSYIFRRHYIVIVSIILLKYYRSPIIVGADLGQVQYVLSDKTGTLTTGKFNISNYHTTIDDSSFKSIVVSLEKYSIQKLNFSFAAY